MPPKKRRAKGKKSKRRAAPRVQVARICSAGLSRLLVKPGESESALRITLGEAVKRLWAFAKARGLQEGQTIRCNDDMHRLFGASKLGMFQVSGKLSEHMRGAGSSSAAAAPAPPAPIIPLPQPMLKLSPALTLLLSGAREPELRLTRTDALRRVGGYITRQGLRDESDKRKIHCDAALGAIVGRTSFTIFEAKSLLEQVALVCQGRSMYSQVLKAISSYVRDDLKQLQGDPAVLLSARPVDDPLESIMYMTSVGVPSQVYETVRSLRQARAARLGALQRKLPRIHLLLLWILAGIELCSFPLLGAGTQTIGGYNILTVEGFLFGIMTFGIVMTLRVVGELWRPAGGAYNVDGVLAIMVRGLETELDERLSGKRTNPRAPTARFGMADLGPDDGMVIGENMDLLMMGGANDFSDNIGEEEVVDLKVDRS